MLDWLLNNHRQIVGASRWILSFGAFALMIVAGLPHNPIDHIITVLCMIGVAIVFAIWLGVVSVTLVSPGALEKWRRRRNSR